jgi:hypothetical protein
MLVWQLLCQLEDPRNKGQCPSWLRFHAKVLTPMSAFWTSVRLRWRIVTSGPGVSNLATGLATANSEGDPMVALGGSVAVADRLKSRHQAMDSVSV